MGGGEGEGEGEVGGREEEGEGKERDGEGKKGLEMGTEEMGNRGRRTRGESGGGEQEERGLQAVIGDEVVIRIINRVVKINRAARVVNRG